MTGPTDGDERTAGETPTEPESGSGSMSVSGPESEPAPEPGSGGSTPGAGEPAPPPDADTAGEPSAEARPANPAPESDPPPEPRHEHHPKPSHAGNATVNHHLDGQGPEGLDSGELALRRMLHHAVQEMEPRDGTLDHLRRAVPARRARKRQAVVGMAAAALLVGTAVPALLHVSNTGGSEANPAMAGQASETQGGADGLKDPDGTSTGRIGSPPGDSGGQRPGDPERTGEDTDTGSPSGSPDGTGPAATAAPTASACTATQLGDSSATVAVPDAAGIVYGTFRVVNVSDSGCTVGGDVSVTSTPQGAADAAKIGVRTHASGDAAAGLPDPSLNIAQLTLAPGSAYDVRFAWVPSETCPTTGGPGDGGGDNGGGPTSSPEPTPSEQPGAGAGGTTDGASGTAPQLFPADGSADGSVLVTYTAPGGSPTVSATVAQACAGTVYRTGVLASS